MNVMIHAQDIADAFWRNLVVRWQAELRNQLGELDFSAVEAEKLRQQADYNTGSVPTATTMALTALCAELKPSVTFEIGTFIGNTTRVLARYSGYTYTCDKDNAILLRLANVFEYPKTTSTDALKQMAAEETVVDLFFADGRVMPDDVPLIERVTHAETIFALDDCYQLEKGAVNVDMLIRALPARRLFYLPPPRGELFTTFGVPGYTTLGLLVPASKLLISQG